TLNIDSSPSGATLNIDGTEINESTPARLTLAPGAHVIELYGPGAEQGTAVINMDFASELSLHVALEAGVAPAPAPSEEPLSASERTPDPIRQRRIGRAAWALSGLALAAGLSVAVLGPIALHKHEQYKQEPT